MLPSFAVSAVYRDITFLSLFPENHRLVIPGGMAPGASATVVRSRAAMHAGTKLGEV